MGYKVALSPDAAKAFRKLDKPIQQRIAALIDKIEDHLIRVSAEKLSKEMTRNGAIVSAITVSFAR